MFEAHTAHATQPQGWVNGCLSVLQVTSAELDSNQAIMPVFRRVLLDVKGHIVLEPKLKNSYRIVQPLDAAGYANISDNETGYFLLCDKKGEMVSFPANATQVSYRGEGIIEFVAREDSLLEAEYPFQSLYDIKQKKVIYRGKWTSMGYFRQGVSIFKDTKSNMGLINRKGEMILSALYKCPIEDDYHFMGEMLHEYFIFQDSIENFVVFNREGKQIGGNSFSQMPVIHHGYISVWDEEKEWYIIDNKGNIVAPQVWQNNQDTQGFNEVGITAVTKDEKYTVINTKGTQIVGFEKGYVAAVVSPTTVFLSKDKQQWDVFNAKGKLIQSISADEIVPFGKYHYAEFWLEEQKGLISAEGKVIIPLGNREFSAISDDFFETREINGEDIRYQYWNPAGKMVLKNPIQEMNADWIIPVEPDREYYTPF